MELWTDNLHSSPLSLSLVRSLTSISLYLNPHLSISVITPLSVYTSLSLSRTLLFLILGPAPELTTTSYSNLWVLLPLKETMSFHPFILVHLFVIPAPSFPFIPPLSLSECCSPPVLFVSFLFSPESRRCPEWHMHLAQSPLSLSTCILLAPYRFLFPSFLSFCPVTSRTGDVSSLSHSLSSSVRLGSVKISPQTPFPSASLFSLSLSLSIILALAVSLSPLFHP